MVSVFARSADNSVVCNANCRACLSSSKKRFASSALKVPAKFIF